MYGKFISLWLLFPLIFGAGSAAFAQIVVEDADATLEIALVSSEFPLPITHIEVEYPKRIFNRKLIPPLKPPEIPNRIVVEYAKSIGRFAVTAVPSCCECDLNHDGCCNILDWPYFIENWGCTNCNDPGVECKCDLNHDGCCNILDWPYFIEDWGRIDCPICPF